jgi:hypothetical protein
MKSVRGAGLPLPPGPVRSALTHPVCVVDDNGVGVAIVGWVCIGVIAEPCQHGSNLSHVPHHVPRDVAGPPGEGFQVHWLDDLVGGPLNPGDTEQSAEGGAGSLLGHTGAVGMLGRPWP